MPKVTNEKYAKFLRKEIIEPMRRKEFEEKLNLIKHKSPTEARVLMILLWSTAARPNEILALRSRNFSKQDSHLLVKLKGSKGSYERQASLSLNDALVKEVWKYVQSFHELQVLFPSFITPGNRLSILKTYYKKQDGVKTKLRKVYFGSYTRASDKLRHFILNWFGVPPYFFRHNRLTIASETRPIKDLMLLKGAKSEASVFPYLHQSGKEAKGMEKDLMR